MRLYDTRSRSGILLPLEASAGENDMQRLQTTQRFGTQISRRASSQAAVEMGLSDANKKRVSNFQVDIKRAHTVSHRQTVLVDERPAQQQRL